MLFYDKHFYKQHQAEIFLFYQNDIHMFPKNIYSIKTIKIKETFLKSVNHKYNQNQNVF